MPEQQVTVADVEAFIRTESAAWRVTAGTAPYVDDSEYAQSEYARSRYARGRFEGLESVAEFIAVRRGDHR